jgi:hypothetical protein
MMIKMTTHSELLDPLWITKDKYENMFLLYVDFMHNINCEYNPCEPNKCLIAETNNFLDVLFLQLMYFQGHLWSNPLGIHLETNYFEMRHNVLIELCKRGVLTLNGSENYYEFAAIIHEDACDLLIEKFFVMSSLGIAINVMMLRNDNVCVEYRFGDNGKLKLDGVLAKPCMIDICKQLHSPAQGYYTMFVSIFSDEYSSEDIMLHYWVGFNSLFGELNHNIF